MSIQQRRARIRPEQPQRVTPVSLVNWKKLGEEMPSLLLSLLDLVRL
jgi:hypothetical protein